MADEDIEETKKLTVEERIKKLKEIEKKNKEEIQKAQNLLRESEEELVDKDKEKADIPIPQLKSVDIGALSSEEEKQMFKAKTFKDDVPQKKEVLEETVFEEEKKLTPEQQQQAQQQYRTQLSQQPIEQLYDKVNDIRGNVSSSGYMNEQQQKELNNIEYALDKKQQDINDGEYSPSEYAANKLVSTKQVGEELKKKYSGR